MGKEGVDMHHTHAQGCGFQQQVPRTPNQLLYATVWLKLGWLKLSEQTNKTAPALDMPPPEGSSPCPHWALPRGRSRPDDHHPAAY